MTAVVAVIKICRDRFPRLPTSTAARPSQGRRTAVEDVEKVCNGGTSLPHPSRLTSCTRSRSYTYTSAGRGYPATYLPTYLRDPARLTHCHTNNPPFCLVTVHQARSYPRRSFRPTSRERAGAPRVSFQREDAESFFPSFFFLSDIVIRLSTDDGSLFEL